ncbi:GMC oxidoreductase [Echria macrotheca]|uniref:GMC oxidoreductase n=1 Tax=Echria macrotheca TaxID=438768 RepID=A0AAJ0F7D6_9PEZI|nr:GMC oxidoreductase [Echria macrotheca]
MGLYTKLPEDIQEVDVIVAGGGSAGCILAGRLAAADPNLSILLIEGGKDNYNVPSVIHPALFTQNLIPDTGRAIFHQANKAEELAGREVIVPTGGTLGGGSSINFMLYTRAQRSDYDSWKTPGWSADELWPFLKKLETYHGEGDAKHHGQRGPVHISNAGYVGSSVDEIFASAAAIGRPRVNDLQNLEDCNGFSVWLRTVSPEGRRQDTAHCYVHPLLQDGKHANLHVLVENQVVRVLFDDDTRASGVEFMPNPAHQLQPFSSSPKRTVRARKMVVVSAGAMGSPQILEMSGIGNPVILERAGVKTVVNLPGVGENYQDHHLIMTPYKVATDDTLDEIWSGGIKGEDLVAQNHKILGWNGTDVCSKLRPSDANVAALGAAFQAAWDRDYAKNPNKPLMFTGVLQGYTSDPTTSAPGRFFTIGNFSMYPYSRGHVHITSPQLTSPPDFRVGYFTDADDIDIKMLIWAYKHSRELARRMSFFRGEHAPAHPVFPPGSRAALVADLSGPLWKDDRSEVQDLEYDVVDDKAIEEWLRRTVQTTWHSLGTNKMAPRGEGGVVDAALNVYGTRGLKVVDLSIAPENVGGNTNNTAMMIGEKGADLVARELGVVVSDGPLVEEIGSCN